MSGGAQIHARQARLGACLAFPSSLVVFCIIMIPIVLMFRYSFNYHDPIHVMREGFTFENYVKFFSDSYYRGVFFDTIKVAAICTFLALLLGFPVAYFLAKTQTRHKSLLIILLVFPLMVGNVVRAAGWMVVLGNAGAVNALLIWLGAITQPIKLLYTPLAVVIGTTAVVLPYMILTLQSVLEGIDFAVEEAAQNLGGNMFTTFGELCCRSLRQASLPERCLCSFCA